MARPQKNNCDYFPHDNNMRNHVKIKAIRNKFENGYSIWVMILEYLTGCDGNTFEKTTLQMELLSGDFGVSVAEISDVIDYCIRLELLFVDNGWIYSYSLNERLAPVYEKRGKSKQLSAKQNRSNGRFSTNNTVNTVVSVAETPQIKVNKIKEKKKEYITEQAPVCVFNFKKSLSELGVTEQILSDWLKVRKTKKAANTETAFNAIKKEIEKSNLPANECIKIAVEKSWSGFKSDWINGNTERNFKQNQEQGGNGSKLSDKKRPFTF